MARPDIAWLPGDGIGREVLGAARLVLDATGFEARYMPGDIGWEFWRKEGTPLPDRTIELLRRTDCALFGAVTSKPEADAMAELSEAQRARGARYSGAVVRIRRMFDLFTNLRPCRAYPGNPGNMREGVDITIFRENTEGMYSGVEWDRIPQELYEIRGMERVPRQAAIAVRAITKRASHRIAKSAFEHAASVPRRSWPARAGIAGRDGERRRVTAVHKANVLRATDGVFLSAVREVARDHPEIEYEEMLVDACAMRLVGDPLHFDVLVTTNMFGDILSDLCAQLVGGLGFAPGAPRRRLRDVRARPRLGARHRRPRRGQPRGGGPVGQADARVARREREGRPGRGRGGPGHPRGPRPHPGHGREHGHHGPGDGDSSEGGENMKSVRGTCG